MKKWFECTKENNKRALEEKLGELLYNIGVLGKAFLTMIQDPNAIEDAITFHKRPTPQQNMGKTHEQITEKKI